MIKAVIFDMYETLITHFQSPLYFGTQIAVDAGIPENKFLEMWEPTSTDRTIEKMTLEEAYCFHILMLYVYPTNKAYKSLLLKYTKDVSIC